MSLSGSACLAIWNDVDPAREAEYNRWHAGEHVPERCGVPGILRGRRYLADDSGHHRYLTLYDLRDLDVLDSAPYRDLVQVPTPWSAAMRPAFRNFLREPCIVLATVGADTGGAAATVRFALAKDAAPMTAADARQLLAALGTIADFSALTLGAVVPAEPHPLAVDPMAETPSEGIRYLLIAEAAARRDLARTEAEIADVIAHEVAATVVTIKAFDLVTVVRHPGSGPRARSVGAAN